MNPKDVLLLPSPCSLILSPHIMDEPQYYTLRPWLCQETLEAELSTFPAHPETLSWP